MPICVGRTGKHRWCSRISYTNLVPEGAVQEFGDFPQTKSFSNLEMCVNDVCQCNIDYRCMLETVTFHFLLLLYLTSTSNLEYFSTVFSWGWITNPTAGRPLESLQQQLTLFKHRRLNWIRCSAITVENN